MATFLAKLEARDGVLPAAELLSAEERLRLATEAAGIGKAYASGVYADGKIYYLSDSATCFVIAAKPKFELIATNKLEDTSRTNASPVIDDSRLLIRTDKHLYCIGDDDSIPRRNSK